MKWGRAIQSVISHEDVKGYCVYVKNGFIYNMKGSTAITVYTCPYLSPATFANLDHYSSSTSQ